MEPALVSVVIPVLNGARFVGEAIDSVLAQDRRPLEIIVVDDGSTDATREVVEAANPGTATLRYVHQPPLGQGAAMNHGVRIARGAMLAFLDHDDLWMPGKLRIQMQEFDANSALDAVFGYAEQFMQDEQIAARVHLPPAQRVIKAPLPSAMLIRRQALDRVGPWNETRDSVVAADWYQRCQESGLRTVMLDEIVMRRRIHGDNMSLRVARHAYFDVIRASLARRAARSGGDPA